MGLGLGLLGVRFWVLSAMTDTLPGYLGAGQSKITLGTADHNYHMIRMNFPYIIRDHCKI